MKKHVICIIIFLIGNSLSGQNFNIKLVAIDSIGRTDTVVFGNNTLATDYIDTALGEVNIQGVPYDSLDLRAIQRVFADQICPQGGYYFDSPINLDTKINYRHFFLIPPQFFEFTLHGTNYPILIYADYTEMFSNTPFDSWTIAILYDTSCATPNVESAVPGYVYIFTAQDSTQNLIKIELDYLTPGVKEISTESINIYPELFDSYLYISNLKNQKYYLELLNITGSLEFDLETNFDNYLTIQTENIPKGVHFIRITNMVSKEIQVLKLIKI